MLLLAAQSASRRTPFGATTFNATASHVDRVGQVVGTFEW